MREREGEGEGEGEGFKLGDCTELQTVKIWVRNGRDNIQTLNGKKSSYLFPKISVKKTYLL